MEAGKERLTRDSVRYATRQEIELKREDSDLKQLVGELSLEMHRFKKNSPAAPPRSAAPAYERRGTIEGRGCGGAAA